MCVVRLYTHIHKSLLPCCNCLQIDELTTELESMKNHQLNPVLEGQNPTDIVRKYITLEWWLNYLTSKTLRERKLLQNMSFYNLSRIHFQFLQIQVLRCYSKLSSYSAEHLLKWQPQIWSAYYVYCHHYKLVDDVLSVWHRWIHQASQWVQGKTANIWSRKCQTRRNGKYMYSEKNSY